MTRLTLLLGISIITFPPALRARELDNAEVRIPYGELKQLLARAEPAAKPRAPKPALLSGRLHLTLEHGAPVIDATFQSIGFGDDFTLLPLVSGDVSLVTREPEDAVIVLDRNFLSLVIDKPGVRSVRFRLIPSSGTEEFTLTLPPCPSLIFETGDLPEGQSANLTTDHRKALLTANQVRALPSSGGGISIRMLDGEQSREASRPPEPSTWTWQQETLVRPSDGELIYHTIARASAADGSGVHASLPLPPDAREVTISGNDLTSSLLNRGENRSLNASLDWGTRGILDRQVMISYRMPLRPLDRTWQLQAPGGEGTRTRFIIASSPFLDYSADGLSPALTPQGFPSLFAESLKSDTCHLLEAGTTAALTATPIPVAATAEGVVSNAEWTQRIEPDGAMLATGVFSIDHKGPLGFVFDTPEGMKLLSCEVNGNAISPVDLGKGMLKVALPALGKGSGMTITFTGSTDALDPVEGALKLSLPQSPLFIHNLLWRIDLPAGYQAETHGNLKRMRLTTTEPPSRITLQKNLCRDERPEIRIFYQRSDLDS